ncbi:MAG: hypothetical protein BMS9Abin25_0490 [Gammaproteobacteria bacterium]|nr:MAG: hypothetical protein BMS9Abin25_0490 [Gammaproteobacteria bacterium]
MKNHQTCQKLFSEMLDLKSIEEGFAAEKFSAILKENIRLPGLVAMDIYRNNSIGARQGALQHIYPVIEKILGERCFNMMANDFVVASPSLDSDLNNYGRAFPDFLVDQVTQHTAFTDFIYLPDLARLEWSYHAAYYAPDDEPMYDLSLVSLSPDNEKSVSLVRSRALSSLSTAYPVFDIWQSHQGNEPVKEVAALTEEDYLLVYRQQRHPEIERINRDEWIILQELVVPQGIEHLVDCVLEKGADVQHVLPGMSEKGWVRIMED